jgi:hypothetical protein
MIPNQSTNNNISIKVFQPANENNKILNPTQPSSDNITFSKIPNMNMNQFR